jgi:DNA-directed RNA polymerase specialized sigma24 family protein
LLNLKLFSRDRNYTPVVVVASNWGGLKEKKMESKSRNGGSRYDYWMATKSDEFLVGAWIRGDSGDSRLAQQVLHDKYKTMLERRIRKTLWKAGVDNPQDWIDDVSQETWIAFDVCVRVERKQITKGPGQLLWGIAGKKALFKARQLRNEHKFENDEPLSDQITTVGADEIMEASIKYEEGRKLLLQLPFLAQLSDCQRVAWMLQLLYKFSPSVVARLMDKKRGVIDTHFSVANSRILEYKLSEEFEQYSGGVVLQRDNYYDRYAAEWAGFFVERLSEPVTIQLTPEELKPLGLTCEEFRTHYVTSLILPGPSDRILTSKYQDPLYVLLTRKSDWVQTQQTLYHMSRGSFKDDLELDDETFNLLPDDEFAPDIPVKEASRALSEFMPRPTAKEYVLQISVEDENLIVKPQGPVVFGYGMEVNRCRNYVNRFFPTPMYFSVHPQRTARHVQIDSMISCGELVSPGTLQNSLLKMNIDPASLLRHWFQAGSSDSLKVLFKRFVIEMYRAGLVLHRGLFPDALGDQFAAWCSMAEGQDLPDLLKGATPLGAKELRQYLEKGSVYIDKAELEDRIRRNYPGVEFPKEGRLNYQNTSQLTVVRDQLKLLKLYFENNPSLSSEEELKPLKLYFERPDRFSEAAQRQLIELLIPLTYPNDDW